MMRSKKLVGLLAIGSLFVLTGQGCLGSGEQEVEPEPISLEIWRVFDNDDTFQQIVDEYRALHPNVTIRYQEKRFGEYEDELIRALAEGRGPDIFSIQNTKMREWQDLLLPMPTTATVTETRAGGGIGRGSTTYLVENRLPAIRDIQQNFVAQVAEDAILPYRPDPDLDVTDRIFALPMSLDTLALYYNQDLLDAAGIASPPTTWEQFQEAVTALTSYDAEGEVVQSGAAIGTGANVERASDILSLLMMQNGTEMVDDRGRVSFHLLPPGSQDEIAPGVLAAQFYTDFANPTKEVYTWNSDFSSSFEAFANGETAMFFGYSYHAPLLRAAAPRLNFRVTGMPQIAPDAQRVNFANYWLEGVSNQTDEPDWAWDFLAFATSAERVPSYLEEANKPTALRALIPDQLEDETISVFADQALTARSWYKGSDIEATEEAFREIMTAFLAGPEDLQEVLTNAAKKVAQTF